MTDPESVWEVVRVDDNGVEHALARNLPKRDAELLEKRFTARGHKQLYVARPQSAVTSVPNRIKLLGDK